MTSNFATTCTVPECGKPVAPIGKRKVNYRYCIEHGKKWRTYRDRGIPDYRFLEMIYAENCDLCGAASKNLVVDHDHLHCRSGKWCNECARGMVCSRCNNWLAAMDQPAWLKRAEQYLAVFGRKFEHLRTDKGIPPTQSQIDRNYWNREAESWDDRQRREKESNAAIAKSLGLPE